MDDYDKNIGEKIKSFLNQSGMTQKELAEKLQIKPASLNQMLSGRSAFPINRLMAIAYIMQLPEDQKNEIQQLLQKKQLARINRAALSLDTDHLAKLYETADTLEKRKKLDRVSKHVANAINDPGPVSSGVSSLPSSPNTIRNTPELRECIKDAMLREGVRDASELNRRIGYDSSHSLERLLAGKLNWFPDVLSAVLDELKIKQDDAPISPLERSMLAPEGIYNQGAILVRPVPVVDWANAADYIGSLIAGTSAIDRKWDPESIETIPAPTGCRKDTIALRVHGQSMEPKIQDGDKIYCEPVENLEELPNNKIVVVRFTDSAKEGAGCLFCKRFRRIGGEIFLTSDNPAGRNFNEVPPIDIAWLGRVTGKYDDDF